jgi:hypothetical protein
MTSNHVTKADHEATRAADLQPRQRRRPPIRRIAFIRPGQTGFRLVAASGELAPTHQ